MSSFAVLPPVPLSGFPLLPFLELLPPFRAGGSGCQRFEPPLHFHWFPVQRLKLVRSLFVNLAFTFWARTRGHNRPLPRRCLSQWAPQEQHGPGEGVPDELVDGLFQSESLCAMYLECQFALDVSFDHA